MCSVLYINYTSIKKSRQSNSKVCVLNHQSIWPQTLYKVPLTKKKHMDFNCFTLVRHHSLDSVRYKGLTDACCSQISDFVTSLQVNASGTISVLMNLSLHRICPKLPLFSLKLLLYFPSCVWYLQLFFLPVKTGHFFLMYSFNLFSSVCDSSILDSEIT